MSVRNRDERVLGPYPHGRRWRVFVCDPVRGTRSPRGYATREAAEKFKRLFERDVERRPTAQTVDEAISSYRKHLVDKGNKPSSYVETERRMRRFFVDQLGHDMALLTAATCAKAYAKLKDTPVTIGRGENAKTRKLSSDTHMNMLIEARTFLRWCGEKGWIAGNPLEKVKGIGRRRHGKKQLRLDEARLFQREALARARRGDAGAVAALMTLLLGLRASEIIRRQVRDLDDGGRLLWIEDTKTEAGRRRVEVPVVLQPHLLRVARGHGKRKADALIFGEHWRDWPRKQVQRICRDIGVQAVTAHGMRGLLATLAAEAGQVGNLVAAHLGQDDYAVTERSYASRGSVSGARHRKALDVLDGKRATVTKKTKKSRKSGRRGNKK